MSAVTEKVAFPKTHSVERDGWTLTLKCWGIYTKFVYGIAQPGQPKGSVKLGGHGMSVSLGASLDPINLSAGRDLMLQLGYELMNKYNKEVNRQFLYDFCKEAFRPYEHYSSVSIR
ncbi:MAG: hypothetical protein A2915_00935 [Candidatus Yanofskybacteria bacterium RIFCSPLOWO2_01_FULL_41_34]|uniref:Uncharacterized protein n=1 Tax=Candidatus Yanofskybacteria bacterium RIFCSPHIGHO2_01_FULL_41_26 TaxID=1802661 RepID=A0A1F8EC66_9BACT|nr:MAG: hypothetical protein A2649_02975 [Candidatus Yanofskybacteria bacterium RIFCSPHIGHO2_01_FULL_41_26]OGN22457.1 MAG: hypothetical protein A2915_00935 [Candidatus Yanofskybacteria bacterium RIFCSPLOWO2_01_FULL_41_34]